jgi:6-phosphogluconolactonase
MSFPWHSHPTPVEAAAAAARHIAQLLEKTLAAGASASFAVSGGSTPRLLFDELVRQPVEWARVHLFWVDERAAPPTDERSNYRLAAEHLLGPAGVPEQNVHRVFAEFPPEIAAERYRQNLAAFFALPVGQPPAFDVIQLGMGADAHTASLFPGEKLLEDRERSAAAVYVEKLAQWRVTLLPGTLLRARAAVFLVSGADKAEAVRAVFQAAYEPRRYPAQILRHHPGLVWFLDDAAARLLKE